jgi:hypothetical protein
LTVRDHVKKIIEESSPMPGAVLFSAIGQNSPNQTSDYQEIQKSSTDEKGKLKESNLGA